jgi:hypothetical protein
MPFGGCCTVARNWDDEKHNILSTVITVLVESTSKHWQGIRHQTSLARYTLASALDEPVRV